MGHREMLLDVDGGLGAEDVEALKFMCRDLLPLKKLSLVTSGIELFELLEKEDLLNETDVFIVAELLHRIQQYSLLKKLSMTKEQVQRELLQNGRVSTYRQLLYDLSENITRDDLKSVKFLLQDQLPKCKLGENMTMLDLLLEMEKKELLTEHNLETLQKVCKIISPDLVKKIDNYKATVELLPLPSQECPIPPIDNKTTGPLLTPEYFSRPASDKVSSFSSALQDSHTEKENSSVQERIGRITFNGEREDDRAVNGVPPVMDSVDGEQYSKEPDKGEIPTYKMNSVCRGYCLIINNFEFQLPLNPRKGSDTDAEELRRVFTWLGFEVFVYRDQTTEGIRNLMKELQGKDHRQRDCFVCCILTHGESGTVYGTDAVLMPIREVTSYFTGMRCPTLTGKPKLFFIQACQGKMPQPACPIESDASSPISTTPEDRDTVPEEADFLIGMATVDGSLSYRHISQGTWYVQTLCRNLREYVPKGEDILSILTKVNKDVSAKLAFGQHKQMPQPIFTLRKRLIFPVPQSPSDT